MNICKCGHKQAEHNGFFGCAHEDGEKFCACVLSDDDVEIAALRAERDTLRTALTGLFQSCAHLPLPEMNRMENEINAASAALKESK